MLPLGWRAANPAQVAVNTKKPKHMNQRMDLNLVLRYPKMTVLIMLAKAYGSVRKAIKKGSVSKSNVVLWVK